MSKFTEVKNILRDWSKGTIPELENWGVCTNFEEATLIELENLVDFEEYPNYSGDFSFPIEVSWEELKTILKEEGISYSRIMPDASWASNAYRFSAKKWEGTYGKKRRHFCAWCYANLVGNEGAGMFNEEGELL